MNVLGADQQALSDCFAHAPVSPGREDVLRRGLARRARPACRSSTARSRRSSARSSRRSAPATTTCSSAASTRSSSTARASRRCSTSGAATCASSRAPTARSKASRRAECRRSGRTASTSATTSAARDRRSSSLHGATSLGAEDFAAQLPLLSKAFLVHLPDARGPRPDALGRGRRLPLRLARRRPRRRSSTALGLDSFHLARVLDGRDDRAAVRRAAPGAAADARRRRDHDAARAAGERRAAAHGPGADPRARPGVRRDARAPARRRAGRGRLAAAAARDRGGHRGPAAAHAGASCTGIDCPAMVVCGDRDPFVPPEHAAGLARQLPGGPAVRRARTAATR